MRTRQLFFAALLAVAAPLACADCGIASLPPVSSTTTDAVLTAGCDALEGLPDNLGTICTTAKPWLVPIITDAVNKIGAAKVKGDAPNSFVKVTKDGAIVAYLPPTVAAEVQARINALK